MALDPVARALLEQHRCRSVDLISHTHHELSAEAFVFSLSIEATNPFRPDNVTSFFIRRVYVSAGGAFSRCDGEGRNIPMQD